jgi:hypothetical protein
LETRTGARWRLVCSQSPLALIRGIASSPPSTSSPPLSQQVGHVHLGGSELEAADLHDGLGSEALERFTEEAILTIFYFYGFLIGCLGAEISAATVR